MFHDVRVVLLSGRLHDDLLHRPLKNRQYIACMQGRSTHGRRESARQIELFHETGQTAFTCMYLHEYGSDR